MTKIVKFIILILVTIPFSHALAQGNFSDSISSPKSVYRLRIIAPGVNFETKLTNYSTLIIELFSNPTIYTSVRDDQSTYISEISINPTLIIGPRFYINIEERNKSNRRTDYYSGLFLSIPLILDIKESMYVIVPQFGFQRTFLRKWYFNINAGMGIGQIAKNQTGLIPMVDIGLGYIIN